MRQHHGLDTDTHVFFYEQEFYVLSNFSAFQIAFQGLTFATVEAAYHYCKFPDDRDICKQIWSARSAHDAFIIAQQNKHLRRADWDDVKEQTMYDLLALKVQQHEYVRRKLLETGDRILVENSWRDDFWGWGPNKDGKNALGKLWMRIRDDLRNDKIYIPNNT